MTTPGFNFEADMTQRTQAELTLGLLGIEHSQRLATPEYSSVIRTSLTTIVDNSYFSTAEEQAAVQEVANSLAGATAWLSATVEHVRQPAAAEQPHQPTGELAFNFAITLSTPPSINMDNTPMGDQEIYLGKQTLSGIEYQIAIGSIITVAAGSEINFVPASDPGRTFWTKDVDGQPLPHPRPDSLAATFSPEQDADLEQMARATTENLIAAYGLDYAVLWNKLSGVWWDVNAPGARDMWEQAKRDAEFRTWGGYPNVPNDPGDLA